jgi:carbonic anhydrase/acetyltransferase-like protein (isoleucine patch superfamily)
VEVPAGSLVMGRPGRVHRSLTEAEIESILGYATRYVGYRLDYMTSSGPPAVTASSD